MTRNFPFFYFSVFQKRILSSLNILMKMLVKDYDKTALRNFVKDMISGKIKTLEFYLNFTLEATREVKKTSKYDSIREEMQEEIYHLDKQMFALKTMQKKMNRCFIILRIE